MKSGGANTKQMSLDFSARSAGPEPRKTDAENSEDHARRIAGFLSMALPQAVDVVFTQNRHTMISYRKNRGRLTVRLHGMFRGAGPEALSALARFLKNREPSASRELDAFIAAHREEIKKESSRRSFTRVSAGKAHDLVPLLERVRSRYFGGLGEVSICWTAVRSAPARRRRRTRSRSRALATYSYDDRSIRVSRVLDSPRVPEFVLEWIIYHEMLHHVLPYEDESGRRRFHTRRFRALERAFERYEEAHAWELANLDWLLA